MLTATIDSVYGPVTVETYEVCEDSQGIWCEYLLLWEDQEWNSIECDNGMVSQRAHSHEDALTMGKSNESSLASDEGFKGYFAI